MVDSIDLQLIHYRQLARRRKRRGLRSGTSSCGADAETTSYRINAHWHLYSIEVSEHTAFLSLNVTIQTTPEVHPHWPASSLMSGATSKTALGCVLITAGKVQYYAQNT